MEIEYLRELVELGRIRSFTKAASRLGISRTTLSKHVAALEHEFGVRAFERDNTRVEPTAAGELLIQGAQVLLDSWESMRAQVRAYRKTLPLKLTVGLFKGHGPTDDLVDTVVENLRARGLPIEVDVRDVVSPCFEALRGGDLDFISPIHGDEVDLEGLEDELFIEEPMAAIVPAEHPLATKDALCADDLSGNVVLVSHDGGVAHYFALVEALLERKGVKPRYVTTPYSNWGSFSRNASLMEGGIRLVHASMVRYGMPLTSTAFKGMRFVEEDMKLPVHITWRKDDPNPALQLFVSEFKAIAAQTDFGVYWG